MLNPILKNNVVIDISNTVNKNIVIEALWLSGSYGRREADQFSDFDFSCLISEKENLNSVFDKLQKDLTEKDNIIFSKVLSNSKTINLIDKNWSRIDITLIDRSGLGSINPNQVLFVYDKVNAKDAMGNFAQSEVKKNDAEEVRNNTNEFIRVIGLIPVALGRDDLILAQVGATLLRDILIKTMQHENDSDVVRGALSLKKTISANQYNILKESPILSSNKEDIISYYRFLIENFIPISQRQHAERDLEWPHKFYDCTKQHLRNVLEIELK